METTATQTVQHRDVEREGWVETFATAPVAVAVDDAAGAEACFAEVAAHLADRGIAVLQEKVFGLAEAMDDLLAVRAAAYGARGLNPAPVTFIDGRPCVGGPFAGVQIIGAMPRSSEVTVQTVQSDGMPVGRLLETPLYRSLYLTGVADPHYADGATVTEQGTRMFARAGELLAEHGFAPGDIVRTWIYLARLLDWYGELNRIRTRCFHEWGLMSPEHTGVLPASTGIQCKRHPGEECFMDVFALSRKDGSRDGVEPMRNTRQNEAYEYGSSFSRGMAVGVDGPPVLFVSGTASINPCGETVYHGDHQGQLVETLLDIHALLQTCGAAFKDVCQAVAYCKGEPDYQQFKRFLEFMDWADMPVIPVYADVCRDELLFEMDAIGIAS